MFLTGLLIALNIRKRKSKSFDRVDNLILILKITMKTLNLTSYGVEEIKEVEMSEVNGGGLALVLGIAAVAIYLYDNRERFAEGFEKGFNAIMYNI